ncbi:MAG: hypothetical protein QOJ64_4205 [Acidobacteriota bacterium]|nr:hypothetical protein [Acidobacteriota bacterium]
MKEVDYFRAQAIELLELRVESIPCSSCFFRSDAPLIQFAHLVIKKSAYAFTESAEDRHSSVELLLAITIVRASSTCQRARENPQALHLSL